MGESMQINGIGSEHNSHSHTVTNCLHEHTGSDKESGIMRSAAMDAVTLTNQDTIVQQDAQFSLSAWLNDTLKSGKSLLHRIWGSEDTANTTLAKGHSVEEQVLAQLGEDGAMAGIGVDANGQSSYGKQGQQADHMLQTAQIATAATVINPIQNNTVQHNPYFSAVEDTGRHQETLWQKVRVKFKDIASQLSGHLPGKFAGFQSKSSLQTKQEQTKEDLRKRSKFREDEVEIDCVLTDDSYLLDSYDKKGEYTKLFSGK